LITKRGDEATKLGVPIIKLRDFLAMTGQRPARSTQEDSLNKIHSSVPATGSPIEKSVAAPRASDEPKDKNGKDKNGKDKEQRSTIRSLAHGRSQLPRARWPARTPGRLGPTRGGT